jgi:hypothetical protein
MEDEYSWESIKLGGSTTLCSMDDHIGKYLANGLRANAQ